jgi:uncharacterized damage-inducible protein DinB
MVAEDPILLTVRAVVQENKAVRAELLDAVAGLSEEQQAERWFGDESWSVRDILSHLYEWQNGFAHALERIARGERPEIPDYNPEDADDVYNALVTERNRDLTWEDLFAHLHAAAQRHEVAVKNLVGRIEPERYEEGRTARRLSDTAEHDHEHIPAILEWRRRQGI